MIRKLLLRDWRNYENVSLDFNEGTTFIVALNGVGKTSLVEAARYALFGTINDAATAVRVGGTVAEASVTLELPSGRLLTATRQVNAKKTTKRTAVPQAIVTIDGGAELDPDDYTHLIATEYGTQLALLARLTMPAVDPANDTVESMGIEDHLGRLYGVDGLRTASRTLAARIKDIDKQTSSIKATNADPARQLELLQARVADATASAAAATARHHTLQQRFDSARQRQQQLLQLTAWHAQAARRDQDLLELSREFQNLTGSTLEPSQTVTDAVESAYENAVLAVTDLDVRIGVLAATTDALNHNRERLDGAQAAHDDCPVCRRPLDDGTAQSAAQAIAGDLARLGEATDLAQAQRTQATNLREDLRSLLRRVRTADQLADPPTVDASLGSGSDQNFEPRSSDESVNADQVDALKEELDSALELLIESRTNSQTAERTLGEAQEADEAMRQLTALFTQQATLTATLQATTATLNEILDQAVTPLAAAVNERWTKLFPHRGTLTTGADGTVTRNVNGHALPAASFSAGEGAGLNLLMRLIVTHMATRADFCWFDEPLEHMDPDTRRHVASMLARAGSGGGPLRQIVITTYEEPLARQLSLRDPDRVHLRDVRQAPAT